MTFLVLRKCWSIWTRFESFVDFRKAGHRQGDVCAGLADNMNMSECIRTHEHIRFKKLACL